MLQLCGCVPFVLNFLDLPILRTLIRCTKWQALELFVQALDMLYELVSATMCAWQTLEETNWNPQLYTMDQSDIWQP